LISREVVNWYISDGVNTTIKGKIGGWDPAIEITRITFHPVPNVTCLAKKFLFGGQVEKTIVFVNFDQAIELGRSTPQDFDLPAALPAAYFQFQVLSNYGGNFTCLPPFELYGLAFRTLDNVPRDQE
jgi:hypothetical protein